MAYISLEILKKDIIDYLERSIKTEPVDLKNLSSTYIYKNIINVPSDKIKKAIDDLINAGELLEYQSDLKIYIPIELKQHENLKAFELGQPLKTILYIYFSGLFVVVLIISLIPYFMALILSLNFSNPSNVIANSVLLGAIFPIAIGYYLRESYLLISKLFSFVNIQINKGALITIISCISISLLIYISWVYYSQTSINLTLIYSALIFGLAFGVFLYTTVLKKSTEKIIINQKDGE